MRTATSPTIDLTREEMTLLSKVEDYLSKRAPSDTPWNLVADAMETLTERLLGRDAIPSHRLQYLTDPQCNVGGHGSSRDAVIERNGYPTPLLRNPAFAKHLRYLIHGPDLPEPISEAFRQKVVECGQPFTGSDALAVAEVARQLTRLHRLNPQVVHEEFHKLALECGLDAHDARVVRDNVMKTRMR